jgi:hypothetical protein
MWTIINGSSPTFYIFVDTDQSLSLIDGLQYDFAGIAAPLRINGDYLRGEFTYEGNITGSDGNISHVDWTISFADMVNKFISPNLLNVDIQTSTDQSSWITSFGTLHSYYLCPKNASESYYWIDGDNWNINGELETGYYGFYLESYPSGYLTYW